MDYKKRYGLKEAPFRLSPDPDFFFPSETHRDALETLLYSIRAGEGFIQITGQPGTGKSMLLRKILKEIGDSVVVGLILHSNIQARDLLYMIMQDLKIDVSQAIPPSRGNLIPLFRDFLLDQARAGNQVIIIVDEAQGLPDETLEELRMLSNLETEKAKLLQIILVGQLELEQRITPARLSQLAQRITIRYRLKPLTREETRSYIFHRLEIAAVSKEAIPVFFQPGVMGAIHKYSRGVPRLINIICERSLMAAYIQGSSKITRNHIKKAILSIDGEPDKPDGPIFRPTTYGLFAIFLLTVALWGYLRVNPGLPLVYYRAFSSIGAGITSFQSREEIYQVPQPLAKEPSGAVRADLLLQSQPVSKPILEPDSKKTPTPPVSLPDKTVVSQPLDQQQIFPVHKPDPTVKEPILFDHLFDQWTTLPQGVEQVGVINMDKGSLVMVRKKGGELLFSDELKVDWPYPQGVYMAGYTRDRERFIFHPEIAYFKKISLDNPAFWQMIRDGKRHPITPLIALNSTALVGKSPEQGAETVKKVVMDWADTWRSMDLEKIMTYFSNVISIYDIDMDQPLVFSKNRMLTIKQNIFQQSGFIRVKLSDPVCIINPFDPDLAYAVFHQTYHSMAYQDQGTKVLYLRRLQSDSNEPDWKITGKLWILDSQ